MRTTLVGVVLMLVSFGVGLAVAWGSPTNQAVAQVTGLLTFIGLGMAIVGGILWARGASRARAARRDGAS